MWQQVEDIKKQIEKYKSENKSLFATSSFQTQSIPLLHILSSIDKSIPVYFINTGYHFPETIRFRDTIVKLLNLNLHNVNPFVPKILQKDREGSFYFTSDPDYCCFLNKTQALQPILYQMNVWISGVRAVQNNNRQQLQIEEKTSEGALRYHPLLHWSNKMIYDYMSEYKLAKHPLEEKGYFSIGCEPCTRKMIDNNIREGRWYGLNKTECGLHTELISKT